MTHRLQPLDAFFLATETRRAPWHMAACEIFEKPTNYRGDFVGDLLAKQKQHEPVYPFNVRLASPGLWPTLVETDVDIDFHLQHQVLPAPGTERQLMAALEHFFSALLDRNLPLWQCCVIDGLERNRFAVAIKVHHALTDGQGGLRIFLNSLSLRKNDRKARGFWADNSDNPTVPSPKRSKTNDSDRTLTGWTETARGLVAGAAGVLDRDQLDRLNDLRLFRAPRSPMNKPLSSSARRFGCADLTLARMRKVAKPAGASINDVLLYTVDAALHRYLSEADNDTTRALICGMPVSVRAQGPQKGNQAGLLTVKLGEPAASPTERLKQINDATSRAKSNLKQLPNGLLKAFGMAVLGAPLLLEQVPGLAEALPVINVAVSNVSPPRGSDYLGKPLYLAGARLLSGYAQPILPPAVLLNVTATSIGDRLCIGIGSTREAIDDPMRLATYMVDALAELDRSGTGRKASKKSR